MGEGSTSPGWRPVVSYEGLYEVSDHGQVRRVAGGQGAVAGRVLRCPPDGHGYPKVTLRKDGRGALAKVHILVAAAFLGPCPDGLEVNHRDGVKANNRATNLEYVTRSGNMLHAYRLGLHPRVRRFGEQTGRAKLSAAQVAEIRQRYRPGVYGHKRLAREFGVRPGVIWAIVTGRAWKEDGAA